MGNNLTIRAAIFLLVALMPAAAARAATPALDPVADAFAFPAFGVAAQFTVSAVDADAADVVTFSLVDPSDGSPSPLDVFLTLQPPAGTTHSASFLWEVAASDAGIYPIRVIATDLDGNSDQADFNLNVFPAADDVTIDGIDGPTMVEVNSVGNPAPYTYTIDAMSNAGLSLLYQLETFSPSSVSSVPPYQESDAFDVTLDEAGLWYLIARVQPELNFGAVPTLVRSVYAYPLSDVTPPSSLATLQLTGSGQITASWPSNPANSTITEYRLTLRNVGSSSTTVIDSLVVPDPANEPASHQFVYDFSDPLRTDLRQMLDDINVGVAPAGIPLPSETTLEIEAITDDSAQPRVYLPIGPTISLREQFPHFDSIATDVDLQPRAVTVTLGTLVLPGGYYTADEVRIYRGTYGSDPALYQVIASPVSGTTATLLDASAQPVASGAAEGQLFATVIDKTTGSPVELEGVMAKHTMALDPPQCWDGVDNDADGFQDLDGGDPGCGAQLDDQEYDYPDVLAAGDRALVVYNVNTTDAASIAEHYRAARGLPTSSLCPVELPPGNFADPVELLGARKTIVETCICRNVMGLASFECDGIAADTIAAASPVTHLVLIKGMPHRLVDNGWSSGGEDPSFDYYLAHSIYNEPTLFDPGENGSVDHGPYDGTDSDAIDYQSLFPLDARARPIDPELDRMVAYGRVEAMTTPRTLDLIDRTLAAEAQGVTGNFLEQGNVSYWDFLARLTTTRDLPAEGVVCDANQYLGVAGEEWPYADCRAGTTASGLLPGEPPNSGKIQNIPYAINAGAYFGRGLVNGHNAFRGFDNMLEWRLEHPDDQVIPCEPLCQDYIDTQQQADCRAASTDFFREIDTSCVGVAPGFLGWQLRSWPVQYYGFQPSGWSLNDNGSQEKTMPHPMTGSPFGDGYVHYGALDAAGSPTCTPADAPGSSIDCGERLAVDLQQTMNQSPHLMLTADKDYGVRFQYRRGGGTTGWVRVLAQFTRDDDQAFNSFVDYALPPQASWTEAALTLTAPVDASPVKRIRLLITATIGTQLRGWLDLDQIEFYEVDDPSQTNLLPADAASFERPYLGPTYGGDWAANVIDRLGGVAWWGSGSHFQTGGWAFSEVDRTIGAFYSGRTLGESLLITGARMRSGTAYGDPLYRPSGAKLYLDDGLERLGNTSGYTFVEDDASTWDPLAHTLKVNAFHGQANLSTTRWSISRCSGSDIDVCFDTDAWVEVESNLDHGVNAVVDHPLQAGLLDLIDPQLYFQDQDVMVRLRVWNPSQEDDMSGVETHHEDLTSYGYLHYVAAANHAPEANNPSIAPSPPSVTEDLVASYEFNDVDGDGEDVSGRSVTWFRNGVSQPTLGGQLTVPAAKTAVGESWHFEIVVSDGVLTSDVIVSPAVTVACLGPDQVVTIVSAELDGNGDVRLHVSDPNPATRVTGYAVHRGGVPSSLTIVATDLIDEDGGIPDVQMTDVGSSALEPLYYRVGAVSTLCGIDGPL